MRATKRLEKENNIIEAAHRVFNLSGFKNSKMEEVASEAGITKVTLYSYFQSKENLYMALTFKALEELIKTYQETISINRSNNGLAVAIAVLDCFMVFNEKNPLYSELLLEYFQLVRTTKSGEAKVQRLTAALQESEYFKKLQAIHNMPFKLALKEVKRGQEDGSIKPNIKPMLATLHAWTIGLGYSKILSNAGGDAIFDIEIHELKNDLLQSLKHFLQS